jgi:hypothetical protein
MNLEHTFTTILLGVSATAFMDLYTFVLQKYFSVHSLNYALVGRWLLLMPMGKIKHNNIMQTPTMSGEIVVGWVAHYAIGVAFALLFALAVGSDWYTSAKLLPILTFALVTVLLPFAIMQPCFGFGFAAAKLPTPNLARVKSIAAHLAFGFGLFISAVAYQLV